MSIFPVLVVLNKCELGRVSIKARNQLRPSPTLNRRRTQRNKVGCYLTSKISGTLP